MAIGSRMLISIFGVANSLVYPVTKNRYVILKRP